MVRYSFSKQSLEGLRDHHRLVQAALCVWANQRLDCPPNILGYPKNEGGVIVNGRPIAIRKSYVIDDETRSDAPSEEEIVVVEVLEEIDDRFRSEGAGFLSVFSDHRNYILHDPLRDLFDLHDSSILNR